MKTEFDIQLESIIRRGQILAAIVALLFLVAIFFGYVWLFTSNNVIARRAQCGWQGANYERCDPAWLATPGARDD